MIGKIPVSRQYCDSAARKSGNSRATFGCPSAKLRGVRGVYNASISPAASMSDRVWPGPIGATSTSGGVRAPRAVAPRADRDVVPVGEDAADPDVRGQLILRDAHRPPRQLLRKADAAPGVDVDSAVPEGPGREDRDRDEGRALARR